MYQGHRGVRKYNKQCSPSCHNTLPALYNTHQVSFSAHHKGQHSIPFFLLFCGYLGGACLRLQQTEDSGLSTTSFMHWECRYFLQDQVLFRAGLQKGFVPRWLPSNSSHCTSPLCRPPSLLSFCKISFSPANPHLYYPSSLVPPSI